MSEEKITFKQACEVIAESKILKVKGTDRHPTAKEIFEYSPTGELFMIFEWYELATKTL